MSDVHKTSILIFSQLIWWSIHLISTFYSRKTVIKRLTNKNNKKYAKEYSNFDIGPVFLFNKNGVIKNKSKWHICWNSLYICKTLTKCIKTCKILMNIELNGLSFWYRNMFVYLKIISIFQVLVKNFMFLIHTPYWKYYYSK